jgi:excisionase family DNA binding protein
MTAPIIEQIRALQQKGGTLWLELSNGRVVQLESIHSVATTESIVGLLREGDFEFIAAGHISAVGAGVHPQLQKKLQQLRTERRAEALKRFEEKPLSDSQNSPTTKRATTSEALLDSTEVAQILQVSLPTLQRWVRRGWIPAIKMPGGRGRLRFEATEIQKFIRRRTSGKL